MRHASKGAAHVLSGHNDFYGHKKTSHQYYWQEVMTASSILPCQPLWTSLKVSYNLILLPDIVADLNSAMQDVAWNGPHQVFVGFFSNA